MVFLYLVYLFFILKIDSSGCLRDSFGMRLCKKSKKRHKKRPAPFHKDASLKKNLFLLLMFRIQGTSSNSLLPSQEYP